MKPNIDRIRLKGAEEIIKDGNADQGLLENIDIRVVDYYHTFGAFIDRNYNKRIGIRKSSTHSKDNFGYYLMDPTV